MTVARKIVAEMFGSALLLAIVVGSGIMSERLSGGNVAVALLANTLATGAGLVVLIEMFGPVSGAHFNPLVTLAVCLQRGMERRAVAPYVLAQFVGAILGVWLAHAMFGEAILQVSHKARNGVSQALSEAVASFGLIGTIIATQRARPSVTPVAVGLFITSAYWFTASTSFANPAVTMARSLSDTFAGIAPGSVPSFVAAQVVGTFGALGLFGWLYNEEATA